MLGLIAFFSAAWSLEFSKEYLNEIAKNYGDYASRRLNTWQKIVQNNKNASERKKLEEVNLFFNLLQYQRDSSHWGVDDYWATPLELVVSGAGDCEDFAVAKYFTLLDMGVPDDKLLIMYVKFTGNDTFYAQAHMVLLYYETPDSVPLVLDNINKEILPADKRTDLIPIYGFNGKGLWQAKELGKGHQIGQASDLKRWSNLTERMKSGKIGKWKDM
ncbi:MAG: transglutaminase-like cysteine peptidase [Proteobacteria bacterium]|nr:transglutaminase-like cysteine peptidase [Pseudomonadota bacterium]